VGFNDSGLERARCEKFIDGFKRGRGGFDLRGREGGNKRKRWCENEVLKHVFSRTNIFLTK